MTIIALLLTADDEFQRFLLSIIHPFDSVSLLSFSFVGMQNDRNMIQINLMSKRGREDVGETS